MLQPFRARWHLTAAVVVAAVVAAVAVKMTLHSVATGAATTQLMVDSPQSALADLRQDPLPLVTRAAVFAQLLTSGAVLNQVAHAAGVAPKDLTAEGPYSGSGQTLNVPTPSPARSVQLLATNSLYHLTLVPDALIPLVTVSVQGPNPAAAGKVANAVGPAVKAWLSALQSAVPPFRRVTIRQLGDAQAGVVNSSSSTTLAGIAAAGILLIGLLSIRVLDRPARPEHPASVGSVEGFGPVPAPGTAHGNAEPGPSDGGPWMSRRGPATSAGSSSGNDGGLPDDGVWHSANGPERLGAAVEYVRQQRESLLPDDERVEGSGPTTEAG
jgi:hypothetical protein